MSLPKEPRQKMINMMYLVLTALLALNVSVEILNAFKTVNDSLDSANGVLSSNNSIQYNEIKAKLSDNTSREKASIWAPKATKAQDLSKAAFDSIEAIKLQIKVNAGYNVAKNDTSFNSWSGDLESSTRLMIEEGEGDKLKKLLHDYKANLLGIDPASIGKEFANKLPLNLEDPKPDEGNPKGDWTTGYFHMTPAIAAVTILNKFQNDIKNSENQVVTFCNNQINNVVVRYDKFGFVGGLSSSYLMPGEKLTVYAGLGATSSGATPSITINGTPAKVGPDGIATTDMNAGGTGTSKAHVVIHFVNTDGKPQEIIKDLDYTVGSPAGVAVSADKMKVLYIGVDNPLTITAGVGSEKVKATFSAAGDIHKVNGPSWTVKPANSAVGEQTINVVIDGKASPIKFRVKFLPPPATFIGTSRGGGISAAAFKAQGGLVARLVESDFEAPYRVISYTLGAVGGGLPSYQQSANDGNRWTGNAASIIGRATPGSVVYFDNIRVVGPDGRNQEVPPMVFQLK
jgi:gliding motility-associated protein GldM